MQAPKVLIADSISPRGVEELSRDHSLEVFTKTGLSEDELVDLIPRIQRASSSAVKRK